MKQNILSLASYGGGFMLLAIILLSNAKMNKVLNFEMPDIIFSIIGDIAFLISIWFFYRCFKWSTQKRGKE